jgi:Late competence development protein ComFB.
MYSLRNVLEDVVVAEAINQLRFSAEGVRDKINISEVAAYALNRLPPLYATTNRGWQQQCRRAEEEFKQQIQQAVEQALLNVRVAPWRPSTLIAVEVIESPADALARLRTIFSMPHLQWSQVPAVIMETLFVQEPEEAIGKDEPTVPLPKGFIYQPQKDRGQSLSQAKQILREAPGEFESYIAAATCSFTNVLEKLIVEETERQLQRMAPLLARQVRLEDAAAYALNRLPPMYATSEEGIEHLREKSLVGMGTVIASTVIQSIMTLSRLPRRIDAPIPVLKFEEEQESALSQVRQIAQRDDITWRNISKLVEDALEETKVSRFGWRTRWQLLGALYHDLQLSPGDAELHLASDPVGDTLLVQANNKKTLSLLTDAPTLLARKALRYFRNLDAVELWSPLLENCLTYTKAEMIMDGVVPLYES